MTPAELNQGPITAALALLPTVMDSPEARVELVAIAQQESGAALTARQQVGGPAHGLWQNELGGGVYSVLLGSATNGYARQVCASLGVMPRLKTVYDGLLTNDTLAAAFARLILWADPQPLPAVGNSAAGWICYLRNWRPGTPHPELWSANYQRAVEAV